MWWKPFAEIIIRSITEHYDFIQYMYEKYGEEHFEWKYIFIDPDVERLVATHWDQLYVGGIEPAWTCRDCSFIWEDTECGDYGEVFSYDCGCYKNKNCGNLKTFPFINAPNRCFVPDFWHTHYPVLITNMDESYDFVLKQYESFINKRYKTTGRGKDDL